MHTVVDLRIASSTMTVAPLVYLLPALLGYLLFVGVSGRTDPLSRPESLADRPSWLLGLWSGFAVALVLLGGLIATHGQSPIGAHTLLAPSGWALAMLMLPGLALWYAYRERIVREGAMRLSRGEGKSAPAENLTGDHGESRGAEVDESSALAHESVPRIDMPPVATFLSYIVPGTVKVPDIPAAPSEFAEPLERRDSDDVADAAGDIGSSVSSMRGSDPVELALRRECGLRAEAEKSLRIARRALRVLADESSQGDEERVDVLVSLEAALDRETARSAELESKLAKLSREAQSARYTARRVAKARARAVRAATRSLVLARQAIRTRALAEERLRESEDMLAARQATIGSLASALEQARSRSRNAAPETTDRNTNRMAGGSPAETVAGAERLSTFRGESGFDVPAVTADNRLCARLARKASRIRPLSSQD